MKGYTLTASGLYDPIDMKTFEECVTYTTLRNERGETEEGEGKGGKEVRRYYEGGKMKERHRGTKERTRGMIGKNLKERERERKEEQMKG